MRYDNKNTLYYLPLGHISFKKNQKSRNKSLKKSGIKNLETNFLKIWEQKLQKISELKNVEAEEQLETKETIE
jgi:hypothetical protein